VYGASSFSPETVKEPGHAAAGVPIVTGAVRIVATGVGEVVAHYLITDPPITHRGIGRIPPATGGKADDRTQTTDHRQMSRQMSQRALHELPPLPKAFGGSVFSYLEPSKISRSCQGGLKRVH